MSDFYIDVGHTEVQTELGNPDGSRSDPSSPHQRLGSAQVPRDLNIVWSGGPGWRSWCLKLTSLCHKVNPADAQEEGESKPSVKASSKSHIHICLTSGRAQIASLFRQNTTIVTNSKRSVTECKRLRFLSAVQTFSLKKLQSLLKAECGWTQKQQIGFTVIF